jgi:RsiW-degrading membrane proteinase PrsW (M82 family)
MSSHNNREPNVYDLIWRLTRRAHYEMKGDHGNPARAWFARLLVLWLVLAFEGPILWQALLALPAPAVAFIVLIVVVRLVRWFLRRP